MNFKDLKISDELIDTLKKNGIKTPTPIQEESILLIKIIKIYLLNLKLVQEKLLLS